MGTDVLLTFPTLPELFGICGFEISGGRFTEGRIRTTCFDSFSMICSPVDELLGRFAFGVSIGSDVCELLPDSFF